MTRLARCAQRMISLLVALAILVGAGAAALTTEGLTIAGVSSATASSAVPAFPGAEGYGALTPGGRGGKVIAVTNLNDSGAGSLRAAVEATGPRIVVFRVGGTIELQSTLKIKNPYITIAGQTAPGGGVTLKSSPDYTGYALRVDTHDVVIRYITIRTGPTASLASSRDGISVQNSGTYSAIFDHVSFSWGVDENIEFYNSPKDITFQNSIVSEGLRNSSHTEGAHSMGMLVTNHSKNISVHHNLFAHNNDRNPRFAYGVTGEIINNLVYNYGDVGTNLFNDNVASQVNVIGNLYVRGPNSSAKVREIVFDEPIAGSQVYLRDNYGPNRQRDADPQTALVNGSGSFVVTAPAVSPSGITEYTLREATLAGFRSAILADVGNSRGLAADGSWYTRRDAVDKRLVAEVAAAGAFTGTYGKLIDCPGPAALNDCASKVYPGSEDYTRWGITDPVAPNGWPILAAGVPYVDSDGDGMPDVWEARYGFDPASSADGNGDADGDGYTNTEEFLNGANPGGGTSPVPTATSTTVATATPPVTSTPVATATPTATATPPSTPVATVTPVATSSPVATSTPIATSTPAATSTPLGTATPVATATPTATPPPTATATPALTPPPSRSTTITLSPAADAYVSHRRPRANYGRATGVLVDASPIVMHGYLRFEVAGLSGAVQNAKLRLYAYGGTGQGPAIHLTSNNWTERGLTWDNKPAPGAQGGAVGAIPQGSWVEYDVTSFVQGNGSVSFVLVPQSTNGVDFYSREYRKTKLRPQLVVTFAE